MAFIESPRFPEFISEGASGGPTFKTEVFPTVDGLEQRSSKWTRARHTYDFSFGIREMADMDLLRDFFIAVRAKTNSFRFKDWNDFELIGENIGTGDGTTTLFQITKTYKTGTFSYVRRIRKPVDGLQVYVDDTLQVEGSDYEVDLTTGIITFNTAPSNGLLITVTGEFDVPVRLDVDAMVAGHVGYDAQDWAGVSLVEDLTA